MRAQTWPRPPTRPRRRPVPAEEAQLPGRRAAWARPR